MVLVMAVLSATAESFYYDPQTKARILPNETKETSIEVKEDQTGVIVSYSLGDLLCTESQTLPGYYSIHLNGFGVNEESGLPDVPFRVDQFELPENIDYASVILLSADSIRIPLKVAAASLPIPASYSQQIQSTPDKAAWEQGAYGTTDLVKLHYDGKSGNTRRIGVGIAPVQYDQMNEEVIIFHSFQYRIEFEALAVPTSNDGKIPVEAPKDIITYLIVSTPTFKPTLNEFINWKKQCGFIVKEIYRDNWTHNTIMSSVDSAYQVNQNLKYLLIVGDNSAVPGVPRSFNNWSGGFGPSKYATDFPYSCLDGDSIPDIYVGRIPAQNKQQASNALAKIVSYEQTPTTDPNVYSSAIHTGIFTTTSSSSFQSDEPFVYTCEMTRDYVTQQGIECIRNYSASTNATPKFWPSRYGNGKEIPIELQRPYFDWDGKKSNINNAINNGVLYVLGCGHGSKQSWVCSAHHPKRYDIEDVKNLTNNSYPIFFNMNCWTGFYGDVRGGVYYDPGETSLTQSLLGSSNNSGAVGVFAASEMSAMGCNDAMTIGFINGLWPYPGFNCLVDNPYYSNYSTPDPDRDTPTLGRILEKGRTFLTAHYGIYSTAAIHNARVMHLFGDPSMWVNTEVPTPFNDVEIEATPLFPLSSSDNDLFAKDYGKKVKLSITLKGVKSPRISLIDKNGESTMYRGYHVSVPQIMLPVKVTITAHNKIPYQYTLNKLSFSSSEVKIISISPNPTNSQTEILIGPEKIGDNIIYDLYEQFGIIVYSFTGEYITHAVFQKNENKVTLLCKGLKKGTHIVALYGDNELLDSRQIIIN